MTLPRMLPAFDDMQRMIPWGMAFLFALALMASPGTSYAQDDAPPPESTAETAEVEEVEEVVEEEPAPTIESNAEAIGAVRTETDYLWTCIAAFLVFFMQAGFALVEAGFTRSKNCVNIIMKNLMDFSIGSITFWLVGFGLMFGASNGYIGMSDFMVDGMVDGAYDNWELAFLIFQTVFAATAATIVSGAMAERTKFTAYLAYSIAITAIVYPIAGSWAWGSLYNGSGWLEDMGFIDFAGSTVVHSVGGWAALAGAIVIGARKGKYNADGSITPILGHNMPLAALGVFILWLGWFGFNPGSTTSLDGGNFARVAVTTNLSAVGGVVSAMILSWIMYGKPDVSFALNGALAGLVSITAPCYDVSPSSALIIGLIGGVVCVLSVVMFDKLRIDDPVGAVSVHGVCGAWGTLSAGLFAQEAINGTNGLLFGGGAGQLITQLIGIAAYFVWAFGVSLIIFLVIKYTIGLRVSEEEELRGLDITEHGMSAYPYLQSLESA
ncbi:MAG: ammonium transporter [Planctomyces sp.]|uniref:Ammonium transporter n=2 Tax=Rubinisphaera brasiliensis TaxID=119 RepID=F0SQU5_RUBBR|nr:MULTISPECIES: ammonium transporter [Rubinisphaera]ADY60166.1 ammonium transporter [Rubinisphaera brasiliensis DSM 5305]MBB03545.1 ammonium transporter [Planctomyces sp.]